MSRPIDVTDQQHQRLKALAALQGKTIKQFALERLFPACHYEPRHRKLPQWEEDADLL